MSLNCNLVICEHTWHVPVCRPSAAGVAARYRPDTRTGSAGCAETTPPAPPCPDTQMTTNNGDTVSGKHTNDKNMVIQSQINTQMTTNNGDTFQGKHTNDNK